MKTLLVTLFLALLTIGQSKASICPNDSEEFLEIESFSQLDSQCVVKVKSYTSWEFLIESIPKDVIINVGSCNYLNFIYNDNKIFIKGTLSFKRKTSMCGSHLGCQYECTPYVTL